MPTLPLPGPPPGPPPLFDFATPTAGGRVCFVQNTRCRPIGVSRGETKVKETWIFFNAGQHKSTKVHFALGLAGQPLH